MKDIVLVTPEVATDESAATDAQPPSRLALADGRVLAWQGYGDPAGRPLHVFHGFPASRLLASLLHERARAAGVCLVAADRPGFGQSSPAPRRTILGWADDVVALADHLGHERFGVLGISCGGAYALACAHAMPQRLSYVGLLAGMGPMDVPALRQAQLPPLKVLFCLARIHRLLASPILLADALLFRANPRQAIDTLAKLLAGPDREVLAGDATVRSRFVASFVEAYRQGIGGALTEAALIARPRGFALADIRVPVHVHQGGLDRHVPPAMGRYLAQALPQGRLHFHPDEGHLSIVTRRFADCLDEFKETAP